MNRDGVPRAGGVDERPASAAMAGMRVPMTRRLSGIGVWGVLFPRRFRLRRRARPSRLRLG
jgi:hypothetical protein